MQIYSCLMLFFFRHQRVLFYHMKQSLQGQGFILEASN